LLFVVSGPSGSGKTTLSRAMVHLFPHLRFSISHTPRPVRPGDQNGRDYYFVSPEEFQRMIDRGEFVEWATLYGHRYGTSRRMLQQILEEGQDAILDIDGQGARQIRDQQLPGIFIFLLPPSWPELERRLAQRETEGQAAMKERLGKARREIEEARWYDYLIVNDELERAKGHLQSILQAERCRRERMAGILESMLQQSFPMES
ncbi:MAG: guanylate kinase, partial [Deltaproteobacteria bacterium]|nr:guanylate kinase [Deltaproteobacteria bacterium]